MDTGSIERDVAVGGFEIIPGGSPSVLAALEGTSGCEDVRFSPGGRRLALAKSESNAIVLVDMHVEGDDGPVPHVTVTGVTELTSAYLLYPHGVDFLDEETIVVSNRQADVAVFRLPSESERPAELTRIDPSERRSELLDGPGSLAVATGADGGTAVVACNNRGDTVTKHPVEQQSSAIGRGRVLLRRWLAFPDGVSIAADGAWIAVSNHHSHTVLLYEGWDSLNQDADPDCILRGVSYPHGVRFSADARHVVVADCAGPYVHVFGRDGERWEGAEYPNITVRVMDDEVFRQHPRCELGDGGPKGIDFDRHGHVLAVASEYQRLAFFDASAILARSTGRCPDSARQLSYELEVLDRALVLEAHVAALKRSVGYRVTTPLRGVKATWLKLRRPAPAGGDS